MNNPQVSNPKDFQVVSFHNGTDFDFTPDMGCMYDGRAIHGPIGGPGIKMGETMTLPYHIGHRLAVNLAKMSMIKAGSGKSQTDANGQPIIKSMWDDTELDRVKNTYLVNLYSEDKPVSMSQTDLLMQKVEALNKMVTDMQGEKEEKTVDMVEKGSFQDKAEVIAALEVKGIAHDKRKSKAELEKLLV